MATEQQSMFAFSKAQSFEFKEEELVTARLLTDLNLKYIKSVLADYCVGRAMMRVDADMGEGALLKFSLESEYQRGAIEALSYIIANHEAAEETINEQIRDAVRQSQDPNFRNPNLDL